MTPDQARAEWQRCRHHIEAALARSPGLESIADVERAIAAGTYQAWFGKRSAAITEIADYGQKKVLTVVHGGGDMGELLNEMEPMFCAFARAMGCDAIMGTGREGWKRMSEKHGYRFGWLVMVKDLKQ